MGVDNPTQRPVARKKVARKSSRGVGAAISSAAPTPKVRKVQPPAAGSRAALQASVDQAVKKVHRGAGPKVDTGTIRPAPARSAVTAPAAGRRVRVDSGTIVVDPRNVLPADKPPATKTVTRLGRGRTITTEAITPPKRTVKRISFGRALVNELEGKGTIAKGLGHLAETQGPAIANFIAPDRKTVKIDGHDAPLETAGIGKFRAPHGLATRFVKDAFNFPAQAIPSLYVPAAAAVEAAQGDTKRGKQLLHDLPHTDPVAALVTGHPGRALKIANQHPGFAALEAVGVKGTLGRSAGRAMRAAPKGTRAHKIASTERAPQTTPGTTLVNKQTYSPDIIRKNAPVVGQVARERSKAKRSAELARRAQRDGDTELAANAVKLDPSRMSDHEIQRRVDERVAANETIRRQNRATATEEAHRAITNTQTPTGPARTRVRLIAENRRTKVKPTAATSLKAQEITSASVDDLRAYRDELAAQHDQLGPSQAAANRTLRKQLDDAIAARPDPAKLTAAAERYKAVMAPRQRALVEHGLLADEQITKAPLVSYAVRHMDGVRPSEHGPVHADGAPVTAQQIRDHMAAHGVREPVYVTQKPGQRGAKNFFVSSGRPPQITGGTRTGAAVTHGTFDAHPDTLIEGAAKTQGLIDSAKGFADTVREFAHQPSLGKLRTKTEADQHARDLEASTGTRWRAVRVQPFAGRQAQLTALLDHATADPSLEAHAGAAQPVREALESAVAGHDGPGPWALVPEAAAARLERHMKSLGSGPEAKALQVVASGFRKTVLATSPSWMAGNVIEAGGRAALGRAGPRSYVTGKRYVRSLAAKKPDLARELDARVLGGGHFAMADRQHIHRDSSQFAESRVLDPLARSLGTFWRAPGPKQVARAWHGWTDLVFRQVNGKLESKFQTAMLGKALRDSELMPAGIRKTSQHAIDAAVNGTATVNDIVPFARDVERMYGKYNAFGPGMKMMVATYTPFIAWTWNAVKFVTSVLPRDHPTATALIASMEQATEEWRKDHGLDLFMSGAVPGFLQGSIPLSGGRHQRTPSRYTPFGAFGDPGGTAAGMVLPQFAGVLAAFKGQDWKGKPLRKANGEPADVLDEAKAGASSFVDSTVPIVGLTKRLVTKGPGALNPVAPVAPSKGKVRKTGTAPGGIDFSTLDLGDTGSSGIDFSQLDLGGP